MGRWWQVVTPVTQTNIAHFVLVHEKLHFISHLPQNVMGEQLIAQLFRSIPEKSWLFKYGRVPLSFALSQWVWEVRGQISSEEHGPHHG
jgi:hypothetical protein